MQKFYILENDSLAGPYTLDDLRIKCIARDTQVWVEEQSSWVAAGDIEGMRPLFEKPLYGVEPAAEEVVEVSDEQLPNSAAKDIEDKEATHKQRHAAKYALVIAGVIILIVVIAIIGANIARSFNNYIIE